MVCVIEKDPHASDISKRYVPLAVARDGSTC